MSDQYLDSIRAAELRLVLPYFSEVQAASSPTRVLEIGAGTGLQARLLTEAGFEVSAIDLPSSSYAATREFPVVEYDGNTLPFPEASFDIVFSSNVLEHVPDLTLMLAQIKRVLKPGGLALHVLPTSAWRLWSIAMFYPWLLRRALAIAAGQPRRRKQGGDSPAHSLRSRAWWRPERHGERGNVLTEAWYFREKWWRARFCASGFDVHGAPLALFYTEAMWFGARLELDVRQCLSRWLGGACRLYVTRPLAAPGSLAR
jgi:SAM-dependent methyltransferase